MRILSFAVLAVLLSFAANAQSQSPGPAQPTIEQQVNADLASLASARIHNAGITEAWGKFLVALGHERDNLQAQVAVLTKERDAARDDLAKAKGDKPESAPTTSGPK